MLIKLYRQIATLNKKNETIHKNLNELNNLFFLTNLYELLCKKKIMKQFLFYLTTLIFMTTGNLKAQDKPFENVNTKSIQYFLGS